jgi:hypothetical protein
VMVLTYRPAHEICAFVSIVVTRAYFSCRAHRQCGAGHAGQRAGGPFLHRGVQRLDGVKLWEALHEAACDDVSEAPCPPGPPAQGRHFGRRGHHR